MATKSHEAINLDLFNKPTTDAKRNRRGKLAEGEKPEDRTISYLTFPEVVEVTDDEAKQIADKMIEFLRSALSIGDFADLLRKTADNFLFSQAVGEGDFKTLTDFIRASETEDVEEKIKKAKRFVNAQRAAMESMGIPCEISDLVSSYIETIKGARVSK